MSEKGYEVYVVIRDKDYPFHHALGALPREGDLIEPWEAGWFLAYNFNGKADYERVVLPIAEKLAATPAGETSA